MVRDNFYVEADAAKCTNFLQVISTVFSAK